MTLPENFYDMVPDGRILFVREDLGNNHTGRNLDKNIQEIKWRHGLTDSLGQLKELTENGIDATIALLTKGFDFPNLQQVNPTTDPLGHQNTGYRELHELALETAADYLRGVGLATEVKRIGAYLLRKRNPELVS